MNDKPHIVLLQSWEGHCLGVYSSYEELEAGVDYRIKDFAQLQKHMEDRGEKPKFRHTMFFVEYQLDYSPEPITFDYAYIHPPEFKWVRRRGIRNGMDPDQFKVNGGHSIDDAGINLVRFYKRTKEDDADMLGTKGFGKRVRGLTTFR